jgi:hypothetical protein
VQQLDLHQLDPGAGRIAVPSSSAYRLHRHTVTPRLGLTGRFVLS